MLLKNSLESQFLHWLYIIEGLMLTRYREIIDESDVYVDVHKAIRRSHPAPKARIQRKDLMIKDTAVKDGNLIDLEEEEGTDAEPLQHARTASFNGRTEGLSNLSSSPKTTLLMRRSSAGQDGQLIRTTVPVKANYEEMRDHLKHLGPSNPASNPKATRVTAVKIKPGHGTAGGAQAKPIGAAAEAISEFPAFTDGIDERTSLLGSQAGKDGIQALHHNYNSASNAPADSQPRKPTIVINDEGDTTEQGDQGKAIKKNTESESASSPTGTVSSVGSLPSQQSQKNVTERRRTSRGYVRSGSITENVVEAGGIRKVVLEATSSGEEGGESGAKRAGNPRTRSKTSLAAPGHVTEEDEDGEDDDAAGASHGDNASNAGSSQGHSNGKKKSRRKKRKGAK